MISKRLTHIGNLSHTAERVSLHFFVTTFREEKTGTRNKIEIFMGREIEENNKRRFLIAFDNGI